MNDEPVSVHSYQSDAGAGEEHGHALDAAYSLAEPRLKYISINMNKYVVIGLVFKICSP